MSAADNTRQELYFVPVCTYINLYKIVLRQRGKKEKRGNPEESHVM
jgi:hypothetical protein